MRRWLLLAAAAFAAALAHDLALSGHPATVADPSPYDGRSPRDPARGEQRLLLALPRPALGDLAARGDGLRTPAEQRAYVRSLEAEGASLRSALRARGIELRDPVAFGRLWNGFAATVETEDVAELSSLGVRALPVRRFYPAGSVSPLVPGAAAPAAAPPPPPGRRPVALLDSGVDARDPALAQRLSGGRDLVEDDDDPAPGRDPRDPRRRDAQGTALAGILTAAGERVLPLRVAGLQPAEETGTYAEYARTDQLLAGLERAVDPDGDGATGDAVGVALVGVNAPYAGFSDNPEVRAVRAAAALGTLVVAPAGNEGRARGHAGTVGSPGAATEAVTVAGLAGGGPGLPRLRLELAGGDADVTVDDAALLGGPPPRGRLATVALSAGARAGGALKADGRLAVVRAGANPAGQAARAAAEGALAVLLADPAARRPLPAVSAGRVPIPVLGVTGRAAEEVLAAAAAGRAEFGPLRPGPGAAGTGVTATSSRGPTFSGRPKPDLAAPAAAAVPAAGGAGVAGGTAVAAARAAVAAARLRRAEPDLDAAGTRARLMAAARPEGGGVLAAGAGALRTPGTPAALVDPPALRVPTRPAGTRWAGSARAEVRNVGSSRLELALAATVDAGVEVAARPARLRLAPRARAATRLRVRRTRPDPARFVAGRLLGRAGEGGPLSIPFLVPIGRPPPPALGPLRVTRRDGEVDGVSFSLGAFDRGDFAAAGTLVEAVERLELTLERTDGTDARRLTPPGGARGLLPALYAYRLPEDTLAELAPGEYRFAARAFGPRSEAPAVARSAPFER